MNGIVNQGARIRLYSTVKPLLEFSLNNNFRIISTIAMEAISLNNNTRNSIVYEKSIPFIRRRNYIPIHRIATCRMHFSDHSQAVKQTMKKLPIGLQDINEIISGNHIYVDKTYLIAKLINEGKHYLLTRPRRFGKSLLISTLKELFSGNRELFKDCAIYNSDFSWNVHPVLWFDFSRIENSTPDEFENSVKREIGKLAKSNNISISVPTIEDGLNELITHLSTENRVVVLVDEYDKPITDRLNDLENLAENREILGRFFATLKSLDSYIQFSFVTGVSKFSQVALFSGANHLVDITMDSQYATLLGYTEEEVSSFFPDYIDKVANYRTLPGNPFDKEQVFDELKRWYNGYRFTEEPLLVYNPFASLLYFLFDKPEAYWYDSGTPNFLIEQIDKHSELAAPISGATASKYQLMDISNVERINITALMYQSGYLTITDYDIMTKRYNLGFPNHEVEEMFINSLIQNFTQITTETSVLIHKYLNETNLTSFFDQIKGIIADLPYQLLARPEEKTFHSIILAVLQGMDVPVYSEMNTNIGRIDLVIEMGQTVYIFELKLNRTSNQAINQIKEKEYHQKYLHRKRQIALVGVNLSEDQRNISDWQGELLSDSGKPIETLKPHQ